MLVIGPDKPVGPKRRLTNTGIKISDPHLPSNALNGPNCLSSDFTWLEKPALEKQISQLSLLMQQNTSSV